MARGGPRALAADVSGEPRAPMSMREFFGILRPYFWPARLGDKVAALLCYIALALSKGSGIISPLFIGAAIVNMQKGESPSTNIALYMIFQMLIYIGQEMQRFIYLRVKETAYREVAVSTFGHLHNLSLHWHINKRTGVVLRAIDRGISSASTVVDQLFLRLIPTIIEMIALFLIFSLSLGAWKPGIVLIAGGALYFAATWYMNKWRRKLRTTTNRHDSSANQVATDTLTNFETVKFFCMEAWEMARYSDAVTKYQAANRKTMASLSAINLTQQAIIRGTQLGVLLLAGAAVLDGESTLGDFVVVNAYSIQLFAPLTFLGTIFSMVVNAFTDMSNLNDLFREQADIQDAPNAQPVPTDLTTVDAPAIEFDAVQFAYPTANQTIMDQNLAAKAGEQSVKRRTAAGKPASSPDKSTDAGQIAVVVADKRSADAQQPRQVLKGVSFRVPVGGTCAVVGSTGAGKSTLSRLLFRFYDVQSGAVRVAGTDVRQLQQASLRSAVGIVLQDNVLFNDSLRYNIMYGRPDASAEDVAAAVRDAALEEFVASLPDGLDSMVGERGLKLSGGEKQRVAIARALLRNPPILVLDEATASLDSVTEAEIQGALARVRSGRTVLTIAHRLSTIKDADQILVLDDGVVLEAGTHSELLQVGGKYASLWSAQATPAPDATPGVGSSASVDGKTDAAGAASQATA